MSEFYGHFLWIALGIIALLLLGCILRAVLGPHTADRLVAVNMMTTLVSISVCVLSFLLREGYLTDVALIFSLLGCLAVIVLTRALAVREQPSEGKEAPTHVE